MLINERRPMPEGGRYCMYLRKSRDEMRQEKLYGETDCLAKHRQMLEYTAQVNGHVITKVYEEVKSGESIADRDFMCELIRDVEAGKWDGVYVMAVDRLSRGSQQDQGIICDLLEITGLFVICPGAYFDPWHPMDADTISYQLFNSRGEYRNYNRRMQDSIKTSVMNGQYIGCYVPYGYDKEVLPNGFKTLRRNDNAKYVEMMFDWAGNDDLSLYAIAQKMNALGVKTPRGNDEWNPTTIGQILSNEVYMGVAKWGKHKTQRTFSTDAMNKRKVRRVTDQFAQSQAEWEPLVTPELFALVKERRKNRLPVRCDNTVQNVFAGLLVCQKCGRTMAYIPDKYTGKKRITHKTGFECKTKGMYQDDLVDAVVDVLKGCLADLEIPTDDERVKAVRQRNLDAARDIEARIAKIDRRVKQYIVMKADGDITPEEYAQVREEAEQDRKQAEEALAEARAALDGDQHREERAVGIHQMIDALKRDDLSDAAKNHFLRMFVRRIEYRNDSSYGKNDQLHVEVDFL